ncbi:hypothetical protein GWI33_007627 [Rhynchophorus ferrugineus]|uniref:Uncharacterized protein n=1 Tax=Rhynchophorus ferrugineus TaxID=354439 RepID=A0A834IE45_RHYFE|nr:hypothetical protein GWI33_007627 [Rhynchophorus ferrugineus]
MYYRRSPSVTQQSSEPTVNINENMTANLSSNIPAIRRRLLRSCFSPRGRDGVAYSDRSTLICENLRLRPEAESANQPLRNLHGIRTKSNQGQRSTSAGARVFFAGPFRPETSCINNGLINDPGCTGSGEKLDWFVV